MIMDEEKVAKIYKITNTVNGWIYIGSTLADVIETRLKAHFKGARAGKQNDMWGKSGANAINGRSVYMLDDNKNIIKIFPSVEETKKFLRTKAHSALCKACRNGTKYKGYYWAKEWIKTYEDEEND